MNRPNQTAPGFSLMEVVIALGVIGIAVVAILGVVPTGLTTGRAAQDETRAAQIAQSVITSISAQAIKRDGSGQPILDAQNHQQLNGAIKLPSVSAPVDLTANNTYSIYGNNKGDVSDQATGAVYSVKIAITDAPPGFDAAYTKTCTVSVTSSPVQTAGATGTASQVKRNFVRVITAY